MGISAPSSDSLEIIALHPVRKLKGINPKGLSTYWEESPEIISLEPVKKYQVLT